MEQHLADSASTVQGLLSLIHLEEKCIDQLQADLNFSEERYSVQARTDLKFHTNEIEMPEVEKRVAWYDVRKELSELQDRMTSLESSIALKRQIIACLSGTILQIARQEIAATHAKASHCPDGRFIGSETLKNIIFQGQKQYIESGCQKTFSRSIEECFSNLEASFGHQFSLQEKMTQNLASHVIEVLGWKDYSIYESDMKTLLRH